VLLTSGVERAIDAVFTIAPEPCGFITRSTARSPRKTPRVVGCLFGNANPRADIPKLLRLYQQGELMLDELVTRTYRLDQVNEGYQDMREHRNVCGMIRFS